jgi:hypothetical protein
MSRSPVDSNPSFGLSIAVVRTSSVGVDLGFGAFFLNQIQLFYANLAI